MDSAFDFCRIDWPGARGVKGQAVGLRVRALSGRARGRKISGARLSGVDGGLDGRIVPQRTGLWTGRQVQGRLLPLDSFWVTEYIGLHGVCSSIIHRFLGRKSHTLWLGFPHCGTQLTLTSESRLRFPSQQKPY